MFAVFFQTAFDAIIAGLFFCKTVCRAESVMLENLPYFQQNLAADLGRVDVVINRAVQSEVALISQIGTYIISAGGKRLRPVITILSGRALGCDNDGLYSLAAMVEFIHTSTLLHDDVVDESELRRGRKTANNLFGNAAAVLVGDFLYTRAFQLMVGSGSMKILEVMADATNIIAEGEVMQLMNIGNIDITEAQYLQVIQYKTAKLFEAAAQVGAILAGASGQQGGAANHAAPLGRKTPTPSQQTCQPAHTSRCAATRGKHRQHLSGWPATARLPAKCATFPVSALETRPGKPYRNPSFPHSQANSQIGHR